MRANKLSARLVKLLACVIIILSTLLGCAKGNEQINTSSQQNTASASYSQAVTESQIGPPDTATVSVDEPTQASAKKQATKENKEDKRESRSSASTKHFSTTKVTTSTVTVQSVTSKKASTVKDTAVTAETACATTSATKQTVTEKPTTVKATTTSAATTATTTTTATQSPLTEITCTISIECAEILDNMDSLKAGHEGFIPSDGVILNTYSVTAKAPATVYDLLKAACSENDIKLTEQKTLYGTYIAGINNIDEKDCGAQSGWTYTVNGKYPSKSCDKYKLSNGDKVVFKYTCS